MQTDLKNKQVYERKTNTSQYNHEFEMINRFMTEKQQTNVTKKHEKTKKTYKGNIKRQMQPKI